MFLSSWNRLQRLRAETSGVQVLSVQASNSEGKAQFPLHFGVSRNRKRRKAGKRLFRRALQTGMRPTGNKGDRGILNSSHSSPSLVRGPQHGRLEIRVRSSRNFSFKAILLPLISRLWLLARVNSYADLCEVCSLSKAET